MLFGRGSVVFFLLGAALLPYVVSQPAVRQAVTAPLQSLSKAPPEKKDEAAAAAQAFAPNHAGNVQRSPGDLAGSARNVPMLQTASTEPRKAADATFIPLEHALQWNLSPAWVMSTFPRVTTELPDLELQGYRMAYVSGTTPTDVAGSLSYYFDGSLRLQKIRFTGSTGDARRLVQHLISRHQFQRRMADDAGVYLYQVEQDGQALSELRVRAASVVKADNSLGRFATTLEMRRPAE